MRNARHHHYYKVSYRPIEAAIRWSDLMRFESRILHAIGDKPIPDLQDFPRWPMLCLNTERIFDAIRNGDLSFGKNGITSNDPLLLDDPDLTVRHVDLKLWMSRFYPDQMPGFLFGAVERQLQSAISVKSLQTLLADREALSVQLAEREQSLATMQAKYESVCEELEHRRASPREVAPRSETTYLNIVGGLLTLLLGSSPSGKPYSSFETMESVISALLAHHEGCPGISERTLWAKFTAAKRQLSAYPR